MAGEGKRKLRQSVRILTGVITLVLLLAFSSVFYKQNHKFSYGEHLDDAVLTLSGQTVTLREFGYYIYEVEAYTQEQALKYNATDPLDYWNTHFSAGMDSQFISEIARDTAINTCIGDLVYADMAGREGRSLTEQEEQQIQKEAGDWIRGLSKEQKEVLGIEEDLVCEILKRKKLAKDFAYEYSGRADLTGYSVDVTELLSGGGDYFNDHLLSRYELKKNEKLIGQISFGRITVNRE